MRGSQPAALPITESFMSATERLQRELRILQPRLPVPDAAAIAHSDALFTHLAGQICMQGPMPFVRFMDALLYAPGLGYYSAGSSKIGAGGDFITAPEISPLFSQCLAEQIADVLRETGGMVLELGAGRGVMAADILATLEQLGALPERYAILDVSADLRQRQQETLQTRVPHLLEKVHWLDAPPAQFSGVLIANEVLDALPVTLWRWHQQQLFSRAVDFRNEAFVWCDQPASAALQNWFAEHFLPLWGTPPGDYESEWLDCLPGWLALFANSLERGAMLFIDYGFPAREFFHPDRHMGTLMCHYRHHAHGNPLVLPGLQDVTAHVDFTAVAETAVAHGLSVSGYTTQGAFLQSLGILERAQAITDSTEQIRVAQQLKRLLMPAEMGELFKVIALTRHVDQPLRGFLLNDRRHQL